MQQAWIFWLIWGIDAIAAAVILYFFVWGLMDGSISSFNAGYWAFLLIAVAGIILGSIWLKNHNQVGIAMLLMAILALPAVLYGLFIAIVIITKPNWH